MNTMTCSGYEAQITYDDATKTLNGQIIGINGDAEFSGNTVEELEVEFEKTLDDFLTLCDKNGVEPQKNYSDQIRLTLGSELHRELDQTAQVKGLTLSDLIIERLS